MHPDKENAATASAPAATNLHKPGIAVPADLNALIKSIVRHLVGQKSGAVTTAAASPAIGAQCRKFVAKSPSHRRFVRLLPQIQMQNPAQSGFGNVKAPRAFRPALRLIAFSAHAGSRSDTVFVWSGCCEAWERCERL
jgi:hypothetical protein